MLQVRGLGLALQRWDLPAGIRLALDGGADARQAKPPATDRREHAGLGRRSIVGAGWVPESFRPVMVPECHHV